MTTTPVHSMLCIGIPSNACIIIEYLKSWDTNINRSSILGGYCNGSTWVHYLETLWGSASIEEKRVARNRSCSRSYLWRLNLFPFFFFFGSFLLFVFHSGKLWNKIIPGQGIYPKDTSRWKTSPSQAFVFQQNKLPYSEISLLLPPLTSHPCSVPESSFSSMTPSVEIYQLSPGFALGLACDSRRMTRSIICVPSLFS